jgi:tripartite ATP-independent transporter DctP family solute receptor
MKAQRVKVGSAILASAFAVAACSSSKHSDASSPTSSAPSGGSSSSSTASASTPAASGSSGPLASASAGGQTFNFRGANANTAGDAFGLSYAAFASCLAAQSSGRIKLTMYSNATLGSDAEALTLAQTGAIDFTETTLTSTVVPDAGALDLPYIFTGVDKWVKAVDGAPGAQIKQEALAKNLKILSFDDGGWREVYGSKNIKSVADFKGLKIRTLQTTPYVTFFKALGAVPSPLAFTEVYLGLQQHTLDAAETALPSMYAAKQYEVSKYVIVTNHALSTVAWAMSTKAWNSLPPDLQAVVTSCDAQRNAMQRKGQLASEANMKTQLTAKGMTYVTIPLEPLQQIAKDKVYTQVTSASEKSLITQIEAIQ